MSTTTPPIHAPMHQFEWREGAPLLGGFTLEQLAQRAGQTPFYAYERRALTQQVQALRAALPAEVELHYAIKANPMPALLAHLKGLVDGLDVASGGELLRALDTGVDRQHISFAGPGKRPAELRQALAAGVLVNVESLRELDVLAQLSAEMACPARVALRINPDYELKGAGMRMGGGAKPFGLDVALIEPAFERIRAAGPERLGFEGFHLFAGSQSLRADAIAQAQQQAYELALHWASKASAPVRVLNLGGGFGIPYFPGDQRLDLAPISAMMSGLVERARHELPQARLVLELGRYLVGEAGVYVCRVVERKTSHGQVYLVCDGGLHHHLAASGNFGQVLRRNYPVALVRQQAGAQGQGDGELETVNIVGPLCTPLDLIADRVSLPRADVGDLVVVFQSGAYGATASPQGFLGHPTVLEMVV
ncbi:pyridoxal-dependent decarboxylase, exosortase A system-associated [Roseateles sp. BYS180W]|uniref:Pyridoxal-dependent decarboxylase, exosortase A system-associated n=1 Tax=Roseateles rivi TaxID=3299028 RepID=A0ABW7FXV5_9BURK